MEKRKAVPFKIAAIYGFIGCLWLTFDSKLLSMIVRDPANFARLEFASDWLYVFSNAVMLYWFIKRRTEEIWDSREALFRAGAELNAIFQASPYAIIALDPNGVVVKWNSTAERMFGWRAEEVAGKYYNLIPPESIEEWRNLMECTLKGEELHDLESRRIKKNGELLEVCISTAPTRDERGAITGILVVLTDITGRKRAEGALQASNRQYRELVDSIDGIVWEMDVKSFRFTFVSQRAERLLGYPAARWLHEPAFWQDHLHPDDRSWALEFCEKATREMRNHEFPYRFIAADGRIVWLRDLVTVIVEDGVPVKLRGVMLDITQQKGAEDKLRTLHAELEQRVQERTSQLESANSELEAFSYSVSHDLRAPLRHIEGFSRTLMEDFGETLDQDGVNCLRRICAATGRMGELINDMMKLSNVSRGEIGRQTVDMSGMARAIALELSHRAPEREATFEVADGVTTEGDPRLLKILLENLLANAWKYTGKKKGAVIEFFRRECEGKAEYVVRDNGAGFDMEYADKLFAPFQRLHGQDEFEGTGIGLATAHRIVKRHGGRVWGEGKVGAGAVFYFTLG